MELSTFAQGAKSFAKDRAIPVERKDRSYEGESAFSSLPLAAKSPPLIAANVRPL